MVGSAGLLAPLTSASAPSTMPRYLLHIQKYPGYPERRPGHVELQPAEGCAVGSDGVHSPSAPSSTSAAASASWSWNRRAITCTPFGNATAGNPRQFTHTTFR